MACESIISVVSDSSKQILRAYQQLLSSQDPPRQTLHAYQQLLSSQNRTIFSIPPSQIQLALSEPNGSIPAYFTLLYQLLTSCVMVSPPDVSQFSTIVSNSSMDACP